MAADIGVDAVKIGMLGTAETVRAVREALGYLDDGVPIVIDPVMVAESGAVLLDDEARTAIVSELLPLATVITPNFRRPASSGRASAGRARRRRGSRAVRCTRWGRRNIVVTGGHRDEVTDVFFDGGQRDAAFRRALSRRCGAWVRVHALKRAGGAPRARLQSGASGTGGTGGSRRKPCGTATGASAAAPGR